MDRKKLLFKAAIFVSMIIFAGVSSAIVGIFQYHRGYGWGRHTGIIRGVQFGKGILERPAGGKTLRAVVAFWSDSDNKYYYLPSDQPLKEGQNYYVEDGKIRPMK